MMGHVNEKAQTDALTAYQAGMQVDQIVAVFGVTRTQLVNLINLSGVRRGMGGTHAKTITRLYELLRASQEHNRQLQARIDELEGETS